MAKSRLMDYEWMVTYTPQEEWIEKKGIFLWLAFFFSEIGAGIYFVSLFVGLQNGWLVGWLVVLVLGGLNHLGYLGNPTRSWRMFVRPASSELSRGLWLILLFAVIGFFQVAPVVFSSLPWTGDILALKVIMGIICILLITHGFITMGVVRALPLWNSSMMIPLSLASGIWVGSQCVALMLSLNGRDLYMAELWSRWSLLGYMAMLFIFLWGAYHSSETARESIKRLLRGDSSIRFYIGVVLVGITIPLIITLWVWAHDVGTLSGGVLFLRFVCVIIGDLLMRYNIMKCAVYSPLI